MPAEEPGREREEGRGCGNWCGGGWEEGGDGRELSYFQVLTELIAIPVHMNRTKYSFALWKRRGFRLSSYNSIHAEEAGAARVKMLELLLL